jgi:hypothetical protein
MSSKKVNQVFVEVIKNAQGKIKEAARLLQCGQLP